MPDGKQLLSAFTLSNEPEVISAQFRELSRQVPLLYSLLIVNTVAVAFTHWDLAPRFLTLTMPVVLTLVCIYRIIKFSRARRRSLTVAMQRVQLRRSIFFAGLFGLTAVSWALALVHYGGAYEQGHIALYISITVIACIFCLMHLPQAAFAGCVLVTGPYLAYYFMQPRPVWNAIALNILLVSLVMGRVLINSFKAFVNLVRSQRDMEITTAEAERLSEENARLAMTDSLTGLPNRRYFFAKLEEAISKASGENSCFAVGVLDLDRFKPVNDTYGHVLGDRILSEVGSRLSALSSPDIVVTRLGGDEFGLLIFDECEDLESVGKRFCNAVSVPYALEDGHVTLGCSGGFAVFPNAGNTASTLFDRSDYALYHAKSEQRGQCAVFSQDHETKLRSARAVEAALQAADLMTEFSLELQPIVDLRSMTVTAVEALARWESPTLGKVSPEAFIPAAERFGMISALTSALFCKALDALQQLPEACKLSFNLSGQDLVSREAIEDICDKIKRSGLPPRRLVFEITETVLMRDFQVAIAGIRMLRKMGCAVVLDDFGAGYSSLSYLSRLPIDKVKVDRSFVSTDDGGRDFLAAIKGLCDNLRLSSVVEGVETAEQLQLVRDLGYSEAQGYFLGRPAAVASFLARTDQEFGAASQKSRPSKVSAFKNGKPLGRRVGPVNVGRSENTVYPLHSRRSRLKKD